jgi:hypothetical protein
MTHTLALLTCGSYPGRKTLNTQENCQNSVSGPLMYDRIDPVKAHTWPSDGRHILAVSTGGPLRLSGQAKKSSDERFRFSPTKRGGLGHKERRRFCLNRNVRERRRSFIIGTSTQMTVCHLSDILAGLSGLLVQISRSLYESARLIM